MAVQSGWLRGSKGYPFKASCYQLSTSKSVLILGIIVGCFVVLWPKIFYPMIEVALRSPKPHSNDNLAMVHPRVRQHVMRDIRSAKSVSNNQAFIGSSPRSSMDSFKSRESGGLFNLLMPFYTIGLFVVFLYTILKFMSKDEDDFSYGPEEELENESPEADQPLIRDFQMDPDHRKFVFSEEYDENGINIKRKANNLRLRRRLRDERRKTLKGSPIHQATIDEEETIKESKKDEQICELKKRLQITEDAMERILEQIGSLNQALEAKGLLMNELANLNRCNESNELLNIQDETNAKQVDKSGDEENGTSGDSVYSSENQYKSTTDYDSDSTESTTSSKEERLEE